MKRFEGHMQYPFLIPRKAVEELRALSRKTGLPQQYFAREAIRMVLKKYAKELRT
jgi:predicted DNA-binding protein